MSNADESVSLRKHRCFAILGTLSKTTIWGR